MKLQEGVENESERIGVVAGLTVVLSKAAQVRRKVAQGTYWQACEA